MAKKRKRRRGPAGRPARPLDQETQPPERGISQTQAARRERKEEARQIRQRALRRFRRERFLRRGLVWGGAAVAIAVLAFFIGRTGATGSGTLSKQATRTATTAGCTAVEKPPDLGRNHLGTGESYTYQQQPPTSGPHDQVPLNAGVYDQPQPETNLVHSLEHGAVEFYYIASGSNALADDVVSALRGVAKGKVIMTPAPQALSAPLDGKSFTVALAFAAWDRLMQCPNTITAAQATTIGQGWVKGFVDAGNAPEHGRAI